MIHLKCVKPWMEFFRAATIKKPLMDAEAVVVLVAHQELKKLSPSEFVESSKLKYVFDTVNMT